MNAGGVATAIVFQSSGGTLVYLAREGSESMGSSVCSPAAPYAVDVLGICKEELWEPTIHLAHVLNQRRVVARWPHN